MAFLFRPKSYPGFTLVELIVSMAIISILTAGLLTYINPIKQINKAKDAQRKHDFEQLRTALETYYSDHNYYPSSIPFGSSLSDGGTVYMQKVPQDPTCNPNNPCDNQYKYVADNSSTPQWYMLYGKITDQTTSAAVQSTGSTENSLSCQNISCPGTVPAGYTACEYAGTVDCAQLAAGIGATPMPTPPVTTAPTVPVSTPRPTITSTPPTITPIPPTITPIPPTITPIPSATLSVSTTSVAQGGSLTVTWSNVPGATAADWLGLFQPGAPNTTYDATSWKYDSSCTQTAGTTAKSSGSCTFTIPSTIAAGTYQIRLLANSGFTLIATSQNFTVTGPTTVTLSAVDDTYTASVQPTGTGAGQTFMAVYSQAGLFTPATIYDGFIKFDLSSIPAGKTVTAATFSLYTTLSDPCQLVLVYQVDGTTTYWPSSKITYNTEPAKIRSIGSFTGPAANTTVSMNMASYVQGSLGQQFGIGLYPSGSGCATGLQFATLENATYPEPKLKITYQ